jgi:hypothetical protein
MPKTKKLSGKLATKTTNLKAKSSPKVVLKAKASAPSTKVSTQETPATVVATKTLASLAPLSAAARAAFTAQTTTQERADLGGRTKSDGVLRDAGTWIAQIAKYRSKTRYGENRLAFLCESTLALADAIATAKTGRTGAASAGALRNGSISAARAVRDELLHALQQVTRGSAEAADVAEAARGGQRDDELAESLTALAEIADAFLTKAKKDAGAAALAEGASLTSADVAAVRSAATALVSTGAARVTAGNARTQDTPEVNLAEGTVLAEMRVARRAFENANAIDPTVPRLVPGPATRHVLGTHSHGKASPPVAPSAPVASPTNGAAGPAAPSA